MDKMRRKQLDAPRDQANRTFRVVYLEAKFAKRSPDS
jgi:hypothetical protein